MGRLRAAVGDSGKIFAAEGAHRQRRHAGSGADDDGEQALACGFQQGGVTHERRRS